MKITEVRIRRIENEGKMRAVASVTFDDCFVVHDIKIIDGANGRFVAMPSRKMAENDFRDIAHPINSVTRAEIQNIILTRYEETIAREEAEAEAGTDEGFSDY